MLLRTIGDSFIIDLDFRHKISRPYYNPINGLSGNAEVIPNEKIDELAEALRVLNCGLAQDTPYPVLRNGEVYISPQRINIGVPEPDHDMHGREVYSGIFYPITISVNGTVTVVVDRRYLENPRYLRALEIMDRVLFQ